MKKIILAVLFILILVSGTFGQSGLNGIWTYTREDSLSECPPDTDGITISIYRESNEYIMNNLHFEYFAKGLPEYKGIYTTDNGIIIFTITHYHGSLITGLENRWYSLDELQMIDGITITNGDNLRIPGTLWNSTEKINDRHSLTIAPGSGRPRKYSVEGDVLILDSNVVYTRK